MPLFPWHRLVTCSHLLLSCGASFACLSVVLSPSGTPVLVVFGRAFLALCLFVVFSLFPFLLWLLCVVFGLWVFLPAFLRLSSLWPLCAASCVVGLPPFFVWFVCCWFCCVVRWLPPPLVVASLPPIGCSPAASWSSFCAGPSLWVSGCFMRRPGCLALMPGVWWCFASSLHFASWQLRPLALCGVLCYPLHHGAFVVVELCAPALRYSSSDDPGPPLDTAKLHTRHSLLHV